MSPTQLEQRVKAPRAAVYRALTDGRAVARWMVPDGMTSEVHQFDPRQGGIFRISLTYADPANTGKTSARTDTFRGCLLRARRCRERPGHRDRRCPRSPPARAVAGGQRGWRISMRKLAALVESGAV